MIKSDKIINEQLGCAILHHHKEPLNFPGYSQVLARNSDSQLIEKITKN